MACRFACLVLFFCITLSARGADMIELKLKPIKGEMVKLKTSVEQKVTQTFDTGPQTMNQTIGLGFTFATQDVAADGVATVKVTYDTVTFKQQSNLDNVEFDSTNPPRQVHPIARGFAALAGQSFTMKITPMGKVTDVQGLEPMIDSIITKLDIPEGPAKVQQEQTIRKEYGAETVKENMESLLAIYPDKPVSIGNTWSKKITITKGLPMVMDNSFTLKDATTDTATLEVRSKLSTNPDAPPIDMGPRKLSYTLNGEQTGTMKLSRATGWVKSANMTQKVTGEASTDAGAGRVTKVPIVIETKVTMEAK